MWFGTWNGLNRFDGYQYEIYQYDPDDSSTISNNFITSIQQDKQGYLWIGTANGLNRLNPVNGKFNRYLFNTKKSAGVNNFYTTDIFIDETGEIWFSTQENGLYEIIIDQNELKSIQHNHYIHNSEDENSLSCDKVHCICEDSFSNGNILWIGTASGLNLFNKTTKIFQRICSNPENPNSLPHNEIWSIHQDKDGNFWIGTNQGGFCSIDRENHKVSRHNLGIDQLVFDINEDINDDIWIGTQWYGLI